MYAIFGLGWAELVVLILIAVSIGAVVLFAVRGAARGTVQNRSDEIADLRADNADLRAENARLRNEVERLKCGSDKKDPPDVGIVAADAK